MARMPLRSANMSVQVRRLLVVAAVATFLREASIEVLAQEAPFGLAWGPVEKVPRPSLAQRESNIIALIYLHDRVPVELRDTEEVVLEVCASEGLQRIVWVSRDLAKEEAQAKYAAALAQGTRRYGKADQDVIGNGVTWPTGRTTLSLGPGGSGLSRIVMTSAGPAFDACSKRHQDITGHPATEHTADMWARP